MKDTAGVVIVGGGLEGAATAWALAERGVTDVVVCERGTVASGMTGKSSGIVRCHYGVSSLAAMAAYGLEVFEKAEKQTSDLIKNAGASNPAAGSNHASGRSALPMMWGACKRHGGQRRAGW